MFCVITAIVSLTLFSIIIIISVGKIDANNEKYEFVNEYPEYHLLSINELSKETKDHFKNISPNNEPGIIKLDFDGDGNKDYAILLRKNDSMSTIFVVLLCDKVSSCKNYYELNVSNYHDIVYLSLAKAGVFISQAEALDTHSSAVKLKHDGVKLTYFGKAEIVLYWNEKLKIIESIQTAD